MNTDWHLIIWTSVPGQPGVEVYLVMAGAERKLRDFDTMELGISWAQGFIQGRGFICNEPVIRAQGLPFPWVKLWPREIVIPQEVPA